MTNDPKATALAALQATQDTIDTLSHAAAKAKLHTFSPALRRDGGK